MLPRTTPEQRSRFFEDVETLITPGFLTQLVVVGGVRFQIRSLGPGDLFLLRSRAEGVSRHEWRVWTVASSIWMVNGHSVLGQDAAIPVLARQLRGLPRRVVDILFSLVVGFFVRCNTAVKAVQTYCYEALSRYRWASFGRKWMSEMSGVSGAARLGLNVVQQMWLAFNTIEDRRIEEEAQWEGFKLVASSNAPTAVKKIDAKDQQRRRDEQEERQRKLDHYFYLCLGVINEKGAVEGADGSLYQMQGPKSVEDLEDEMRRWVTKDPDHHDEVVMEYKAKVRQRFEEQKYQQQVQREQLEQARQEMGWEQGEFRPQPLMALTAEQLQEVLANRGSRPGVTFLPKPPDADRLFDKFIRQDPDAGQIQVDRDRLLDPAANPQVDARTLEDLLKDRKPVFRGEG